MASYLCTLPEAAVGSALIASVKQELVARCHVPCARTLRSPTLEDCGRDKFSL